MATSTPLLSHPSTPKRPTSSCSPLCVFLSLAAIICPTALVSFYFINSTNHTSSHVYHSSLPSHICETSHNPDSCLAMVSQAVLEHEAASLNNLGLLHLFLNNSVSRISDTIKLAHVIMSGNNAPKEQPSALADCVELMSSSIDRVLDSMAALRSSHSTSSETQLHDAHTWLSAVLTNHVTCLDGLDGSSHSAMKSELEDLIARARTSLAILTSTTSTASSLSNHDEMVAPLKGTDQFPSWVAIRDRKLLAAQPRDVKANVVVAKDGTGNYKTLKDAIASAPDKSTSRYVIYVKKGTYKENVEVGKKKQNIMIVGDGMGSTIITGSRNVIDGDTTFNSATLAAVGDGFILQDIWIQNTAGPQKHQAVALRVGADRSVINRCRIDAYQDTLYAHSLRQFYRDCEITGTVDFIFGNAAVVLQNCNLSPRKPMKGQKNMVTAQGRTDPNQNTGTSIQKCNIVASADLAPVISSFPSYLGRPWKEYSRTVVMQSNIGNVIDPAGWAEWSGSFALNTLYYGEYMNRGPGAGTSKRVKWPGYHVITKAEEAMKFTVAQLIQGGTWLKSTGVAFTEGL